MPQKKSRIDDIYYYKPKNYTHETNRRNTNQKMQTQKEKKKNCRIYDLSAEGCQKFYSLTTIFALFMYVIPEFNVTPMLWHVVCVLCALYALRRQDWVRRIIKKGDINNQKYERKQYEYRKAYILFRVCEIEREIPTDFGQCDKFRRFVPSRCCCWYSILLRLCLHKCANGVSLGGIRYAV